MADKSLSESSWKSFAKGKSYKDAPLLKALVDVSRAEREPPEAQIKSLEALDKQADALLKLHKGDKELASYMAEMGKAAERARKSAEQADKQAKEQAKAAQKAAEKAADKQAGKDDGDDDDDESPALLTTKLLPLLRLAIKGEPMHAMVASAGKVVAVLLSRRPIPMARRKVLAEQLGGGGIKYFVGQCVREDGTVTFVLAAQVTGLAKRLKAALLAQTGLRVNKLRCRGEDGATDHDDDEEGPPMLAQGDASSGNAPAPWPNAAPLDKARAEWSLARQHAVAEIARLKALLGAAYRDAAGEQEALAKALQRLDATMASMDEALTEQIDQLLKAAPGERAGLVSAARSTLERLLGFVTRDEILTTIDGNELAPEMKVAEPLHTRLQAIAAALG